MCRQCAVRHLAGSRASLPPVETVAAVRTAGLLRRFRHHRSRSLDVSATPVMSGWSAPMLSVLVDSTLDPQQVGVIEQFISSISPLRAGVGTSDAPCSIAALNLALSGELTDEIPPCMSPVVGTWVIWTQDAMPDAVRNSERWRMLLPLAAGTGSRFERERFDVVLAWMWDVVALTQRLADEAGAGKSWRTMCLLRSSARASRAATAVELDGFDGREVLFDRAMLVDIARRVAVATDPHASLRVRTCAATRAGVAALELCAVSEVWEMFDPVETLVDLVAVSAA